MKRFVLVLLAVCGLSSMTMSAYAEEKPIEVGKLPGAAKQFVQKYFASEKIEKAVVDNDEINLTYEVRLSNGVKVEFNSGGEWRHVDSPAGVPASLVPEAIAAKVAQHYPGAKIIAFDRERSGYTAALDNKEEMHFNKKFQIMQLEDAAEQ